MSGFSLDTSGTVTIPGGPYVGVWTWETLPSDFVRGYLRAALESLRFFLMECPSCEWDCIIGPPGVGDLGTCCPLCAADNGRDVQLRTEARIDRDWAGTVEGSDDRKKGYSDLSSPALTESIADCAEMQERLQIASNFSGGSVAWEARQSGWKDWGTGARKKWPSQTPTISNDGKVHLRSASS